MSSPEIGLHIKGKQMDKKEEIRIRYDREVNGISYRNLGKKYGIAHTTLFNMLKPKQEKPKKVQAAEVKDPVEPDAFEGDEKALRKELRKLRLENELLKIVIDISGKELGVDLLKKHGTRQS
jgi:hypothetical protein